MAKVASFSGMTGLQTNGPVSPVHLGAVMIINIKGLQPVEYFSDSHLSSSFPQADAGGGGVGQDVPPDGLLGISLKSKTGGGDT